MSYRVEIFFVGFNKPEVSYHYDCDHSEEAIAEAMENIEEYWRDRIIGIEWEDV